MKNKENDRLSAEYKITGHISKVINSCKTSEQLENAKNWSIKIIHQNRIFNEQYEALYGFWERHLKQMETEQLINLYYNRQLTKIKDNAKRISTITIPTRDI